MIRVNDNYVINVDSENYTACFDNHKIQKDGRDSLTVIGYYSSLCKALEGIRDDMVRKSLSDGEKALCEAVECLRKANKEFEIGFNLATGEKHE